MIDNIFWLIVDSDKRLELVGLLFHSGADAHSYAQRHLSGRQDWRVIPIKLYEVL